MKTAICYKFGKPLAVQEINIEPPHGLNTAGFAEYLVADQPQEV